jgi:hypothetical protein
MRAHQEEFEQLRGAADYRLQEGYLDVVIELARRNAVSRMMYLVETR